MEEDNIQITELFGAKCGKDWSRFFIGTIRRETDATGNQVVYGNIKVLDGYIAAQAVNQDVLGSRLDELVKMVLDYGLHSDAGVTSKIADMNCFLN